MIHFYSIPLNIEACSRQGTSVGAARAQSGQEPESTLLVFAVFARFGVHLGCMGG
ncbi:hypothetical protein KDA_71870 [Dictyobacter alpinus]|uniref:Uncharacterized protein n=1 Tax=Dictyobacter alpinus TaxID=2014873 RepID=A0A402BK35_9CHLR|nr:hypothetical protein KDA_71870 [Dictyobacter alpinus]